MTDLEEFCRSRLTRARTGACDDAIRDVRNRLGAAASYDREHLYLTLVELYAIKQDVANMLEAFFVTTASPSTLGPGIRQATLARIMRRHIPDDLVERRFRFALAEQGDDAAAQRTRFLLGLHLLADQPEGRRNEALELLAGSVGAIASPDEALEFALALEHGVTPDGCSTVERTTAEQGLDAVAFLHCSSAGDVARVNLVVGMLSALLGRLEPAAKSFGRLLAEPADLFVGDVIVRLAKLAEREGAPDKAIRRLEEGLHHGGCRFAFQLYVELCRLLDDSGRTAAAHRVIAAAADDERVFDVAALHLARARHLTAAGKTEAAGAAIRAAAELPSPQAAEARLQLARHYAAAGDRDEQLLQLAALDPSADWPLEHRLSIANACFEAGASDTALAWYRTMVSTAPPEATLLVIREDEASRSPSSEVLLQAFQRYRTLADASGTPVAAVELLRVGRLLLPVDPRSARSLLRQAAAHGSRTEQVFALALLGRIQLDSDSEVALATLRRAAALANDADELPVGEVLFLISTACERTGREDEVGWNLRKATKAPGLQSVAAANLALARYWLRHGEPVRALALLRRTAHGNDPASCHVLDSFRANALELAGDARAARELYAIVTHSRDSRLVFHAHCCLAGIAGRKGLKHETSVHLDRAMDGPTPWQKRLVRLLRGRYAHRRGEFEAALAEYDVALWPTWHEFGLCCKLRAQALDALQRRDEAGRSYQVALVELLAEQNNRTAGEPTGMAPFFLPELLNLRSNLEHESKNLRAELVRLGWHERTPTDEGTVDDVPQGVAGVRRLLKSLLDADGPPLERIYRTLSDCFTAMGRKKEGRACLRRADVCSRGSLVPTTAGSVATVTSETAQKLDIDAIPVEQLSSGAEVVELTALLSTGPRRAASAASSDDDGATIRELERAVGSSTARDRSRHLFGLGNALFDAKRFDEAAQRYTEALLDPTCPQRDDVLHNLGITWNELAQYTQAVERFDAVLARGSTSLRASSLYHKGNALLELGRLDEASTCYRDVVDLEDAGIELRLYSLINLAHCRERLGERFEAKRCLLEALGRSRQPGWIMLRLAALDANHGDMHSARNWKERARDEFLKENDIYGLSKLTEILKGI